MRLLVRHFLQILTCEDAEAVRQAKIMELLQLRQDQERRALEKVCRVSLLDLIFRRIWTFEPHSNLPKRAVSLT